jgi:MFS family permease
MGENNRDTANQRSAPPPPGDRRRNLMVICLALCVVFIVHTMLLVTVPLYALSLGASPSLTGVILAVPYLLPLLLAIPMGAAVTRFGARNILILGAAGLTLSPSAVLIAPGYPGLMAAQVLVGLGHTLMVLAAQSIVAGLGCDRSLERYFGWYAMFVSVGQLIGPMLAGWLIDARGIDISFRVMVGLSIVSLVGCLFLTASAQQARKTVGMQLGYRAQFRLLTTNPGIQLSLAVSVAVIFALAAVASFLPVYLESLALPATTIGALLSLRALCSTVIRPFMPFMVDLAGGRPRAMMISVAAVGLGLMATGATGELLVLGVLTALIGFGCGVSQPLSMVVLAEHAPTAQRASALGMRLTANRIVQFLAPLVVGFLAEAAGFGVAFAVAGAVVTGCLVLIIRLAREGRTAQEDHG